VIDTVLTNTNQILTSSNSPFFGAGNTQDVAAVNFYYSPGGDVSHTTSVNGVRFDNINLIGSNNNVAPPPGPYGLVQNVAGVVYTQNMPFTSDNTQRNINLNAVGADAANLNAVAGEIFYISTGGNHPTAQMTFSNLGANRNLYVQVIGGDQGWNGDLGVIANGAPIGTWTTIADTNANNGSLFAFDTTSNASGQLQLDFTGVAGNFAGIGAVIISGQGMQQAPAAPAFSQSVLHSSAQILGADAQFMPGVGANFRYSNQPAGVAGTVSGIAFQDVDWLAAGGSPQAIGGGVSVQVVPSFADGTARARSQVTAPTINGADELVLESIANTINFLGSGESEQINLTGLIPNRLSRIQIIGGDAGTNFANWLGDFEVTVNGNVMGVWNIVADDNQATASLATIYAPTNALGQLNVTLRQLNAPPGQFAGIAGIAVSQAQAQPTIPEPASLGLLSLGALALLRRRRA
jgi:hypothetical protein